LIVQLKRRVKLHCPARGRAVLAKDAGVAQIEADEGCQTQSRKALV